MRFLTVGIHALVISLSFVKERSRLTQRAIKDVNREAEATAQSIISALSTEGAAEVLDKIRPNTRQVIHITKDRQQRRFQKLLREKQASNSPTGTPYIDKTKWVINLSSRSLRSQLMR